MQFRISLGLAAALLLLFNAPSHAAGGGGGYYGDFGSSAPAKPNPFRDARRKIASEKFAEAIPLLKQALADKPNDPDILNFLGYASRKTGDFVNSLDYYKRALAIDPDHKDAHEYLGELYLQTNKLSDAQGQLAELTRLCPKNCSQRKQLEEAISKYQAAQTPADPNKS